MLATDKGAGIWELGIVNYGIKNCSKDIILTKNRRTVHLALEGLIRGRGKNMSAIHWT